MNNGMGEKPASAKKLKGTAKGVRLNIRNVEIAD